MCRSEVLGSVELGFFFLSIFSVLLLLLLCDSVVVFYFEDLVG